MNLLAAKIYFDGSNWIAIPHTERPYRQKRQRKRSKKSKELQQFEERFEKVKGGRNSRKAKLLSEFTPMFKDENEAEEFVEQHFERLSRNRWERYKRMIRRGYTNTWNYFCTYTYDSEKHTEETFRKSLMNTLYHLSSRRGWRYMGAWERGELGQRLHFHALTYIPEGEMPGELEEHEDYSTKRHRREKSIQNSYFNERFGRSDFSKVGNAHEVGDSIENIYAMMGWDRNCRYKVLGRIVTSNRGLIFVFELAEAIMFSPLPDEYFDKRTGQMKKRRIVYYPDEYKGRIGKSYHDYVLSQQMNMFEDLEGYVGDEAAVAK